MEDENVTVADVRNVVDGDLSPSGSGSPIRLRKAIEVGHVFKLGTKYSVSMKASYLDKNGKAQPHIMGCYGIGLTRTLAAALEAHHDEAGAIWPMSIAPFEALVVSLDPKDEQVMATSQQIHDELAAAGVDVLWDDRDERAGFKFKDADLIGIPLRIVVGKRALGEGVVEFSIRKSPKDVEKIAPAAAVQRAKEFINSQQSPTNS
ncbi:MAG TPA: His/Gly/Thr/Pro-type tRNA ligase C-terminal domain-containing protein, partial [Phycisphaerae bacterium]|nr:His/Gly/Thr/Pro-type tRNA ligase C-terminal domain-containing protein [Phycisphaerae bacterium]